jgi:urease gamma subunit
MNFKVVFFMLFIGASSAAFISNTNSQVAAKKKFESVSSIFGSRIQQKAAVAPEKQDDILTQITNVLIQMAIEYLATGTISQASQDLLVELLLHAEIIEVLQILETLVDLLPQEMIDFLVDLGILPPTAKAVHLMKQVKQDDIVAQITNLLIQIAIEFIATGTVSDASLAALTELLTQIDVLELLNLLDSLIGFLIPQELIDFLVDLGILPPAAKDLASMKTTVAKQDDIIGQVTDLLIQIAIEWIATGTVSDASLAALTELLSQVDLVELLGLLDALVGFLIPQELIDFLVDLGILPPAASALPTMKRMLAKQDDILDQITNLLIQIAIEFIATGTVSDASLAALTELLTQIDVLELLNLLDSLIGFLIPQELIDFLVDLGILPPAAKDLPSMKRPVAKQDDILDQITNLLIQIAIEFIATGTVSDASLAALTELLTQIDVLELLNLLDSLIGFLIPQELIDFLIDLGILPPATRALYKQDDIVEQLTNLLIQIAIEWVSTGTVSDASLAALTELLTQIDVLELLGILESLVGVLIPQELIDFLVELGILPPPSAKAVAAKQDILAEFVELLFQIVDELATTGEVSQATLDLLTQLLVDIEAVIGADWLAQLISFIEPFLGFLPQEVIDILTELGILPVAEARLKAIVKVLSAAVAKKDIWQDLVDTLIAQLVQILADLDNLGITVSDEVLAQIETLILAIMAEGGVAWETLQAWLEQYAIELQEILGDILAQLGILP